MTTLTRPYVEREADRRLLRFDQRIGDEIGRLRLDAGVTFAELARVTGVDASHISRIERGLARPSIELLMRIGVALGADPSLRYFSTSHPRLRDRFQAPMVEGLLRVVHHRWRARLEVPITDPARGIIDIVLDEDGGPVSIATECCSQIDRLEQTLRWNAEKADGLGAAYRREGRPDEPARVVSRLLVLRSTTQNRAIARRFGATLATAYPAPMRDVVMALTSADREWPGPGIIWMDVAAGSARLLKYPPHGVAVGR